MVVNLSEQYSLLCNWISEIRDEAVQQDRMRFRRNLERIGEVAAYEISKTLPFVEKEVQTPLGIAVCKVLKEQPVITTILRAGVRMPVQFIPIAVLVACHALQPGIVALDVNRDLSGGDRGLDGLGKWFGCL